MLHRRFSSDGWEKMKKFSSVLFFFLILSVPSYARKEINRTYTDFSGMIPAGEPTREKEVYKTYTDIGEIEEPAVTISQVLNSPDGFHRKMVTLEGRVGELKFREMANGRKFTLFRFFENDPEKRINVYARGYVEGIESGSRIRIWGFYSKYKRYLFVKRENIMKANKIQILSGK